MKVLLPLTRSSEAPTLVNILSATDIVALSAGTKEPTWARRTKVATCLIYVDLPDILGPVRIHIVDSVSESSVSFDINSSLLILSTMGCLPFSILIKPSFSPASKISGLT